MDEETQLYGFADQVHRSRHPREVRIQVSFVTHSVLSGRR